MKSYGTATLGRVIVMKIEPEKDLLTTLEDIAIKERIKTGIILSGIGSLKRALLRNLKNFPECFPIDDKDRFFKSIDGPLEILSLEGNIVEKEDGKIVVHAHISLSSIKDKKIPC